MADPEIVGGEGCGRSRAAEGREGVGGYPLTTGKGSGEGAVPPPQKFFFNFGPHNGQFRCTVGAGEGGCIPLILPLDPPLTHRPLEFKLLLSMKLNYYNLRSLRMFNL